MEDNVVYLKRPKRFTLEEARALIPAVQAATAAAIEAVEPLVDRMQAADTEETRAAVTEQIQSLIDGWTDAITRLGAVPKGLWLVDFDAGDGYFCFHHGDDALEFFHGYDQGFANRVPIPQPS